MNYSPQELLFLVRHAKSSWQNPALSDLQRPLNQRGERDLPGLALRLAGQLPANTLIITSPALRALATAQGIAKAAGTSTLITEPDLYMATPAEILSCLKKYARPDTSLCLVSHNPGLEQLIQQLDPGCPAKFPTAAAACFDLTEVLHTSSSTCQWWDKPKLHPPYTQSV